MLVHCIRNDPNTLVMKHEVNLFGCESLELIYVSVNLTMQVTYFGSFLGVISLDVLISSVQISITCIALRSF